MDTEDVGCEPTTQREREVSDREARDAYARELADAEKAEDAAADRADEDLKANAWRQTW